MGDDGREEFAAIVNGHFLLAAGGGQFVGVGRFELSADIEFLFGQASCLAGEFLDILRRILGLFALVPVGFRQMLDEAFAELEQGGERGISLIERASQVGNQNGPRRIPHLVTGGGKQRHVVGGDGWDRLPFPLHFRDAAVQGVLLPIELVQAILGWNDRRLLETEHIGSIGSLAFDDFIEASDEFPDFLGFLAIRLVFLAVLAARRRRHFAVEDRTFLEIADIDRTQRGHRARAAARFVVQRVGMQPHVVADGKRHLFQHRGHHLVEVALVVGRDGLFEHPFAVSGGVKDQAHFGEAEIVAGAYPNRKLGDRGCLAVFRRVQQFHHRERIRNPFQNIAPRIHHGSRGIVDG